MGCRESRPIKHCTPEHAQRPKKLLPVMVRFTSFGPFLDVQLNPSKEIALVVASSCFDVLGNALPSSNRGETLLVDGAPLVPGNDNKNGSSKKRDEGAKVDEYSTTAKLLSHEVLPVTIDGVTNYVQNVSRVVHSQIEVKGGHVLDEIVLLVHFGVHMSAETVKVETRAYNEAHFPAGDAAGVVKQHEVVFQGEDDDNAPPFEFIEVPIPVEVLSGTVASANEEFGMDDARSSTSPPELTVSSDAGRYLCNYLFLHSLQLNVTLQDSCIEREPRFFSVFVHVMDTRKKSAEVQGKLIAAFLKNLITALRSFVATHSNTLVLHDV